MKHLLLVILCNALSVFSVLSQCPNNSIYLHSQSEVDQFLADYGSCVDIQYGIRIVGDDIVSLSGLCNLKSIAGDLVICENPLLINLNGLEELEHVSGDLEIKFNSSLQNLNGLYKLKHVEGDFAITDNTNLINIDALQLLTNVGTNLFIRNNASLQNLDGLSSLNSIDNEFLICDNPSLGNLDGLMELDFVGSILTVKNNPVLTDCSGLCPFLDHGEAGEEITIKNNPSECSSQDEIETVCSLLPISWMIFDGEVMDKGIELRWTIAGDEDINSFILEHSKDGQKFSALEKINLTQSDLFIGKEYKYYHENPAPGTNYYRLKIYSIVADPLLSDVIMMHYEKSEEFLLYPLACGDKIYFYSPEKEVQEISVFDLTGKLIFQQLNPKEYIDLTSLLPGQYILRVNEGMILHAYSFFKLTL